jgi:hypothetical protein
MARPAGACGNAVERVVDPKVAAVARAEQLLDAGQSLAAVTVLVPVFPALKTASPGPSGAQSRAQRVAALATARLDGAITIRATGASAWRGESSDERAANLEWAAATMRLLAAARAYEPSIETDLGETLAHVPKFRAEALHILSALADRDLLASAEGYAALARLRAAAGDHAGRDNAVRRCETLARTPEICRLPSNA